MIEMGLNDAKCVVWILCRSLFAFFILIHILFYIQVVTYKIHELGVPWSRVRIEMGLNDVRRILWALGEFYFILLRSFDTNQYFILYNGCTYEIHELGVP